MGVLIGLLLRSFGYPMRFDRVRQSGLKYLPACSKPRIGVCMGKPNKSAVYEKKITVLPAPHRQGLTRVMIASADPPLAAERQDIYPVIRNRESSKAQS